ncbi:MAG: hypothetical protein KDC38_02780 [Planctomycetes bacterium]|nr:hypothetical protein [Planctomycetota bacterium]
MPSFQASKKKGASPVVVIVTLVALLGAITFFVVKVILSHQAAKQNQEPVVVETTSDKEFAAIKSDISKAMVLKREAFALKDGDDSKAFNDKVDEAKAALRGVLDKLDAMLDPVRDENGELPPDYRGYSQEYDRVTTALHDLIKSGGF